jgi:predicted Rossmann fold nucleotide-binding protein DprA/Smf involved in DNA uptake
MTWSAWIKTPSGYTSYVTAPTSGGLIRTLRALLPHEAKRYYEVRKDSPETRLLLDLAAQDAVDAETVAASFGISKRCASTRLLRALRAGLLRRSSHGWYRIATIDAEASA